MLIISLAGVDPDDAFSGVPYEKGSNFLCYLEKIVGEANFSAFVKEWITQVRIFLSHDTEPPARLQNGDDG